MSEQPNHGTAEANGLRFGYLEWGSGPLVLCFHGFPDSAYSWDLVGPAIAAAGFRVVAPFLRGYAPSGIPAVDADSRTLGTDILALISALGATSACVVGHDWGAESSYAAVGLDSTPISKLVTIGIPHRAAVRFTPGLVWAIRHFLTLRLPGAEGRFAADNYSGIEYFWKRWSPTWKYSAEDLAPVKQCFAEPGVVHAALGYYRASSPALPDYLRRKISVPTLCIAGADDPSVSPAVYEACRPHFTGEYSVVSVPGGHFCHRESPEATSQAIVAFLTA